MPDDAMPLGRDAEFHAAQAGMALEFDALTHRDAEVARAQFARHVSAGDCAILAVIFLQLAARGDAEMIVDAWSADHAPFDGLAALPGFDTGSDGRGRIAEVCVEWAALATEADVKHMALACFGRLAAPDRVRFLAAAQKAALAA